MAGILVVEADKAWQSVLAKALTATHRIGVCSSYREVLKALQQQKFDAAILDLQVTPPEGVDLLLSIRKASPYMPVIVTSSTEKAELVVKVIRNGAFDFVVKPYSAEKMVLAVTQALEKESLRHEIDYLRRRQDIVYDFDRVLAVSPVMKKVIATVKKLSDTNSTILVTGETGTGKSFLAGTIHFNSPRRQKPFIMINCANIPETLLESELFGHEKGAFTGALKTRAGRFEQANEGTVFLDEIGELSPALQAKLLRVLEEKSFERVGGNQTIHSDIRVIAATNRLLERQVADGAFREDLYYRINVLRVHLPPLRERQECIEPLANLLLEKICRNVKKHFTGFSPEVIDMFKRYHWPGNIRQLSNAIERAALLEESSVIQKDSVILPEILEALPKPTSTPGAPDVQPLSAQERGMILNSLERSLWIQKDAAKLLGITPRALNYKIKKFGITHPSWLKNR
jgi:DNA-binding NtrC family response regulator